MKIVGTITRATLKKELGTTALPGVGTVIPSPESFRVGDVLLHRDPRVAFGRRNIISEFQRLRGHKIHDASWSHVSMYIGNGMIAESVPSTKLLQTGIAASFLYRSAIGVEIQVLRPRDLDWKGYEAANYVSTAILRGGVRYGFGRLFSNIVGIRVPKKLEGAICSEFILEGLAIGSLILVTEYEEIMNSSDLFLPADFSSPEKFARIEPDYLEVVA